MINAYLKMWKNTFNYQGIASRKDYWLAILSYYIIYIILLTPTFLIDKNNENTLLLSAIPAYLYLFIGILPILSLTTRRLHDIGKSGWWQLLILVPAIGAIVLFIFICLPQKLDNRFQREAGE